MDAVRIYRVQDREGRGPFKPGFSKVWADDDFAPGMKPLPTFMEEFGHDIIERLGRVGEYFGSGVLSHQDICKWFSATERRKLCDLGYDVVSLKVSRLLASSENQVLFARETPLHRGAIIVGWPVQRIAS
jgi:hypothetical protein